MTAHRSPHPPPNVAFSQTPCTPCPGRGTHYREQARATNATETACLCGRTCSLRAPTTRRTRRACVRAPSPERPLPSIAAPAANSLSRPYLAHEKRKQKAPRARSTPFCPRSSSRRHRMRTRDSLAPGARALARVPTGDHRRGHRGVRRRGDRRNPSFYRNAGRGRLAGVRRRGPEPLAVPAARRTAPRGARRDRPRTRRAPRRRTKPSTAPGWRARFRDCRIAPRRAAPRARNPITASRRRRRRRTRPRRFSRRARALGNER